MKPSQKYCRTILETTDKLVRQLVSMFDQLPLPQQDSLLTHRWDKIGGAAMLPILKRHAQRFRDFPEMNESKAYESRQLSGSALRRSYELDPPERGLLLLMKSRARVRDLTPGCLGILIELIARGKMRDPESDTRLPFAGQPCDCPPAN